MNENKVQEVVPDVENDNDDIIVVDEFDTEALKSNLKTTIAKKQQWREKARKKDDEIASLKAELEKSKPTLKEEEKPKETVPQALDSDIIADNLDVLRNLSSEEYSELRSEAKDLGVDPIKYIKSKSGQSHLKEYREVNKSNEATPSPSGRIPTYNGKPVHEVLKDSNASAEDKQKAFESRFRKTGVNSSQ